MKKTAAKKPSKKPTPALIYGTQIGWRDDQGGVHHTKLEYKPG